MKALYGMQARTGYRPRKPAQSMAYVSFVRKLPCIACGGRRFVDGLNFGHRGLGEKADDRDLLPACIVCREEAGLIGRWEFAEKHGLDVRALIAGLNAFCGVER